jgi:hypothetical protein
MVRPKCFATRLALTGLLTLASCSSDDSGKKDATSLPSAAVEIGPEGGELRGDGANGFDGFVLTIPPGAFTQRVKVSFTGVVDTTPLPAGAERVGPQLRILPEGTVLTKPARLTMPMDHELRSQYENAPEECKVWARDGGAWARFEPVATTETSVTVELTRFPRAAAAGVIAAARALSCTTCVPTRLLPPTEPACTDPSGYCLVEVPSAPELSGDFNARSANVVDGDLYYSDLVVTPDANGIDHLDLQVRRYGLEGAHAVVVYPKHRDLMAINGPFTFAPLEVQADKTVWATVGGVGNVRIPTTGLTSVLDVPGVDTVVPAGLVRPEAVLVGTNAAGAETLLRFTSSFQPVTALRFFFSRTGTTANQMYIGLSNETIAVKQRALNLFALRSSRSGVCFSSTTECRPDPSVLNLPSYGAFATSVSGVAAATTASSSTKQLLWRTIGGPGFPGGRTEAILTVPAGVSELAFDETGSTLYAISSSRPEIMIIKQAAPEAITILPLTDAPTGSPEYNAMVPRRLMNNRGKNELVLVTVGTTSPSTGRTKSLFRVRKAQ